MIHDDDQGFHVPKRVVTVELALSGRRPERAQVFVAAGDGGDAARRAVVELLEHAHAFLPTQSDSDRSPQIFNKDALVWVAIAGEAAAAEADDEEDTLFEYRHEVRVELTGGTQLSGELLYSLPADHARVVDYLNASGRFFRLWTGERLYLVNKTYVERVVETPLDLEE